MKCAKTKRPNLADLRESGSIEQDADVVMFVYREEYYLNKREPERKMEESEDTFNLRHDEWMRKMQNSENKAEVVVAKQRHGPIGSVQLHFEKRFTHFTDLTDTPTCPRVLRIMPHQHFGNADNAITIDLKAIVANWCYIDSLSAPATKTAAVVKANGYGLGSCAVATALAKGGCELFVANLKEGFELRAVFRQTGQN